MTLFAQLNLFQAAEQYQAVLAMIGGMLAALLTGTLVRWIALRGKPPELRQQRMASLRTWWIVALLLSVSLLLGHLGGTLFIGLTSLLALGEYTTLTRVAYRSWHLIPWVFGLAVLHYVAVGLALDKVITGLVPIGGLILISARMVVCDRSEGFLLTAASLYWGMMLTVYALSHAARLWTLPETANPIAGNGGWFLYLIVLTEMSDITQALIGRRLGRRKIAPILSPKKTWEGFLGGVAVTTLLAMALAPPLTPLADLSFDLGGRTISIPFLPAALAGLVISISGYFGDLTISGIKRDVNVKDSGTLLPGQGGLLDRVDSLLFASPAFYYYLVLILPR